MLGSEGLIANDSIGPILKNESMGIGFIGLAETLAALTGNHYGECIDSRKLGVEIKLYYGLNKIWQGVIHLVHEI